MTPMRVDSLGADRGVEETQFGVPPGDLCFVPYRRLPMQGKRAEEFKALLEYLSGRAGKPEPGDGVGGGRD